MFQCCGRRRRNLIIFHKMFSFLYRFEFFRIEIRDWSCIKTLEFPFYDFITRISHFIPIGLEWWKIRRTGRKKELLEKARVYYLCKCFSRFTYEMALNTLEERRTIALADDATVMKNDSSSPGSRFFIASGWNRMLFALTTPLWDEWVIIGETGFPHSPPVSTKTISIFLHFSEFLNLKMSPFLLFAAFCHVCLFPIFPIRRFLAAFSIFIAWKTF